ncbi:MAG: hypothetical protein WCQ50_07675 [Spirochaetota bacterium]
MEPSVFPSFSLWDPLLLVVVTLMGTLLAYIPDARWKAFILGLPFPFTISNLSLGLPVGPSQILGIASLLLFVQQVRLLHLLAKLPIVPAILISDATYVALALILNRLLPNNAAIFWIAAGLVLATGLVLLFAQTQRREAEHRSPLPLPIKVVAIAAVVIVIVLLKNLLGGFMAVFPMVTTIAAYEARKSLWTISAQIPVLMITLGPMIAAMWLAQHLLHASIPLSLLAGWATFLAILLPVSWWRMRGTGPQ